MNAAMFDVQLSTYVGKWNGLPPKWGSWHI